MAYAEVTFENPKTGEVRNAPVGFSWTTLFFSFIPAFVRSDWKFGGIQLVLACLTLGASSLVFMFIYNKIYIKELIAKGFKAKSVSGGELGDIGKKLQITIPKIA